MAPAEEGMVAETLLVLEEEEVEDFEVVVEVFVKEEEDEVVVALVPQSPIEMAWMAMRMILVVARNVVTKTTWVTIRILQ